MNRKNPKYMVTSGFLGAGKTTSMIAFADDVNRRYGKAAILANDLGAQNIVDADYTATTNILTTQITGNCICYQHENLVDKLHQLVSGGADVIFSDIPGCGIGALDHVYLQLEELEPGEFELMPFTCIVDPERLAMIMPEQADLHLPQEMRFLLKAQMEEADLIVLNKIDLLSQEALEEQMAFLKSSHPDTPVMAMSAATGAGVQDVVDYLMTHRSAAKHKEIGYGSEAFVAAEQLLCWYNRRVFFEADGDTEVDFNSVIDKLFHTVKQGLVQIQGNVPHLKMFAAGLENDFIKASLIGVDHKVEYAQKLYRKYNAISVIINARAVADSQDMSQIIEDAIVHTAKEFGLRTRTYFIESFGMMDEGKGNGGRASRYD